MKRSKEGWFYTTLLLVDVAIITSAVAWFAGWWPQRTTAQSRHLAYGDTLPSLTVKDIGGTSIELRPDPGTYQLLFLMDPNHEPVAEEKYRIDYLNILLDRYFSQGLRALAVLAGDTEAASKYGSAVDLQFPIIPDPDRSVNRRLTVRDRSVGLLLVDGQGTIRYAEFHEFPPRDILRQIVEKYIVGQVQTKFPEVKSPLLVPGRKLPPLTVRDVRGGESKVLGPDELAGHTLLFFTADCSSCQFTRYLSWLGGIEGQPVTVFVTSGFYRDKEVDDEILSWSGPLVLVEQPFDGLEDRYNTRHNEISARPTVVRTGSDGTIVSVEPFSAARRTGE
jgi:hypothetical protein